MKNKIMLSSKRARMFEQVSIALLVLGHLLQLQTGAAPAEPAREKLGLAPHNRPSCQLPPSPFPTTLRRPEAKPEQEIKVPLVGGGNNKTSSSANKFESSGSSEHNEPAAGKSLDSSERLRQLRQLLANNNYDAYLVTPNDEHGSEYVTDYDRRLRFLTGFAGSNGFALVLMDRAVLFTDGRYALQADRELDCNWWLVVGDEPEADIALWLRANNLKNLKIATDARLMSLQTFELVDEGIKRLDSEFALISQDLVDVVWSNFESNEPQASRLPPSGPLFVHNLRFTGNVSWQDKLVQLADSMERLRARHYVVSGLDDIAWLLNLRGSDIPSSPLFKAYLFISLTPTPSSSVGQSQLQPAKPAGVEQLLLQQTGSGGAGMLQAPQVVQVQPNQVIRATLYVDLKKITTQIRDHLHLDNGTVLVSQLKRSPKPQTVTTRIQLELKDYDVFIMDLRDRLSSSAQPVAGALPAGLAGELGSSSLASSSRQLQGRLLLEARANVAIHVLAKGHEERTILLEGLISKLKAVKSDSEVQGMRLAHWRDSLAISMLLAQLEEDIERQPLSGTSRVWTETSAAKELEFYRSLMDFNRGQSFPSISAYGPQAAIVHYQPSESEPVQIGNDSTFLLDTGGQYLDGTTDITRTVHFGRPTNFQRETYTRVLMGAIDMMSLVWEQPTRSSFRLNDLLSRRHLFELGLDYKHGTGHGIGLYSLVHESPRLIEHYTSVSGGHRPRQSPADTINTDTILLQPNMFSSVEPGFYKANEFGIRLENIVVTQRIALPAALMRQNDRQEKPPPTPAEAQAKAFLRFEPISLVPFEPKLIKFELLSNKQKAWLNSYNLMVRLRMTQQINYYLTKIRDSGQLSAGNAFQNRTLADGYYNFLAMAPEQLRQKLEQTHRWLLAKTELVPLDVPQALIQEASRRVALDSAGSEQPPTAATSSGQRLMLTYMSSLPFNDAEAAEAVASLQEAGPASGQLSGRGEPAANGSSANNNRHDKCSGLECDLWLLEAMNSVASVATAVGKKQPPDNSNHFKSKPAAKGQLPNTWSESLLEPDERLGSSSSSSLMDLFQLSGPAPQINMWPLLLMGLLVALQVALLAFVCRSKGSSGRSRRAGRAAANNQTPRRPIESQASV